MVRVIDGSGAVLGRLCSHIAKDLLTNEDEEIALVNCDQVIVTGSKEDVFAKYKFKRDVGTHRKGPFFPRMPDRMVKRTVRGMVPFQQAKGRMAIKRLKCYIGVPEELEGQEAEVLEGAKPRSFTPHVKMIDISRQLGSNLEVKS